MATALSLYGFWTALAIITFSAIMVWRNTFDRDRNGLISERACRGFVPLLGGLVMGAAVIAITSGLLGAATGPGSPNQIPILAQRIADSHFLSTALTLVIILWWYALLSVAVVNMLRHRQLVRYTAKPTPRRGLRKPTAQ